MTTVTYLASATQIAADWLLVIMATFAVLTNVAVLRSAHRESFLREAIRRMAIAGSGIMATRWWYLLLTTEGLGIHVIAVMGMTIVFASKTFDCLYTIFSDELDAYFQNKNLFGSTRRDS